MGVRKKLVFSFQVSHLETYCGQGLSDSLNYLRRHAKGVNALIKNVSSSLWILNLKLNLNFPIQLKTKTQSQLLLGFYLFGI